MKILVTYQSKTGFTKKYAEWISSEVNAELKDIKSVDNYNKELEKKRDDGELKTPEDIVFSLTGSKTMN